MHINRGNPAGHEVLVDSWPEFKAVLTRPCREVATDDSDFFTNMYAAFYHDRDAYRTILQDSDAVNWAQSFRIHGHQDGICEASQDAAAAKQVQISPSSYFTYLHPDPNKLHARQLDPSMRLSTLNSSHIDLLNETWPYGGSEHSRGYLATLVRSFPNACLLDSNGRLVSWSTFDPFGAMAHGYTLPEYRGRGCLNIVNRALAMHVHASGFPAYGNVALDNVRMQNLNEHWGYQRLGTCQHEGIQSIHGPVLVKLNWKGTGFKAGSWGKDFALGAKLQDHYWVFPANKDHRTMETFRLYASYKKMMLYFPIMEFSLRGKKDGCENCGQGGGAIFYNSSFFYNCYDSRALCKMDPDAMRLLRRELDAAAPASFNDIFSYKGVRYQDMDMAGDEKGLWMIYGSSKAKGNMVIRQVDPSNLKAGRRWNTTQPKPQVTNSFMICGVLYATRRVNATHEEVFYYYDTNAAQEGNMQIFMEKALPTVQSLNYNPNDGNLYMFNDAHLVYYNVTFKNHVSVISRRVQVAATTEGQGSDRAVGQNVVNNEVQADASKQDRISDLAHEDGSNTGNKAEYAVVHGYTM